jgi:hypothetical protein
VNQFGVSPQFTASQSQLSSRLWHLRPAVRPDAKCQHVDGSSERRYGFPNLCFLEPFSANRGLDNDAMASTGPSCADRRSERISSSQHRGRRTESWEDGSPRRVRFEGNRIHLNFGGWHMMGELVADERVDGRATHRTVLRM